MRLVVRLLIAGLALASGGTLAGCSGVTGLADAQGATNPVVGDALWPGRHGDGARGFGDQDRRLGPELDVVGTPVGVKAKEGILVDATTGQVLWSKDANVPLPIASITKVMAALVILQAGGLNREITVPKGVVGYVAKYGAEAAGLVPGQTYTTDELLHIMLVMSAADAAYTLANAYGPGLPAFIAKMNVEASALGLAGTHFTSPDGLPYPTEYSTYSTPADLVTLGEAAMQNPAFRSIVDLVLQPAEGTRPQRRLPTSDDVLIGSYPGVIGIKTGYTNAAGHTLLFEAVRNGRTLIGVVLGSPPTNPFTGPRTGRSPQLGLRPQAIQLTRPPPQPRRPPQSPRLPTASSIGPSRSLFPHATIIRRLMPRSRLTSSGCRQIARSFPHVNWIAIRGICPIATRCPAGRVNCRSANSQFRMGDIIPPVCAAGRWQAGWSRATGA